MEEKYIHDEIHHNLQSPSLIVPVLVDLINPKSVVDVGCGIGTFLNVFKKQGIKDVLGLDGAWVNQDLLQKYISKETLKIVDLEKSINEERKFDLAISLEVAEHISEQSANIFVENLTKLSDVIVFSAAFPGQGGQNHINEQWPAYWGEKFNNYGFQLYDVLRPLFWHERKIDIWYRQNMFLILKSNKIENKAILRNFIELNKKNVLDIVHPEYYTSMKNRVDELEGYYDNFLKIKKGEMTFMFYLKLIMKFILVKLRLR